MALTVAATQELPEFSAQTRLLVVAPHPDDETIATGLLIQRVRAAGGEVKILLLTAGDNNPWPQRWLERKLRIVAADQVRWGQRRQAELAQALRQLDVPPSSLQKLDWPDMGVTDVLLQTGGQAIATLSAIIDTFCPSIIAMPSIDDRHPDHGAAHVLMRLALAEQNVAPLQLAYLIHGPVMRDRLVEVAGTAAQSSNKLQALTAHHSQMALSRRRMQRLASRPERYATVVTASPTSATVLPWRPPVWLRPWLRLSVVDRFQMQSWSWAQAPLQRTSDGRYWLDPSINNGAGPRFAKLSCDLSSLWIYDRWGWCAC